jgi:hypothetical protein
MQQGRVYFPSEASWLPLAKKELLRFPAGVHDDIVDALAWATTLAIGSTPPRGEEPPKLKSWRDKLTTSAPGEYSHMTA